MFANEIGPAYLLAAKTMEIFAATLMSARLHSAESVVHGRDETCILKDEMLARAIRMIWENEHSSLTVDDLLEQLPVTRRTLERKFRHELGRTILEEINLCYLQRASRLLIETKLPIQTIAQKAGFPNTQRVYQVFRRVHDLSPSEYRQKHGHH